MNIVWFCIGIVVGAILYTILISIFVVAGRADHANTTGGKMTEERRNELVDRLWDIIDQFELNECEIASICIGATSTTKRPPPLPTVSPNCSWKKTLAWMKGSRSSIIVTILWVRRWL